MYQRQFLNQYECSPLAFQSLKRLQHTHYIWALMVMVQTWLAAEAACEVAVQASRRQVTTSWWRAFTLCFSARGDAVAERAFRPLRADKYVSL